MTKVRATERGYFGGEIRDPGDVFDVPDEIMADDRLRPSWVETFKAKASADRAEAEDPGEGDDKADRKTRRRRADVHPELEPEPDWVPAGAKQVDE